ncbi:distal membrane-arm assembly complex protein 2 [Coccinella septempunctata]|uniref:distal membrane-arm assembly complex protein 2 n=1 Tax=Coccinella septempunctata TaxID=41139 RepID=UPI001D087517|nr:distal membrane-arm assembly complex protein 2 [Coccinella septempunctata]
MNIYSTSVLFRSLIYKRSNLCCSIRIFSSKNDINKEIDSRIKIQDYDVNKVSKDDLNWRWSVNDENKEYFKSLRLFYTDSNNVEIVKALQTPLDLSFSGIKNWLTRKNKQREISEQTYNPERNEVLGNELAAAHFVVFRGGAVKFHGDDKWIKADEYKNYNLPEYYVRNKYIEAIDCSDTDIYYEGLQNFRDVKHLKWLSLNDCQDIDDWCIDTICAAHYKTLVYLDLRNCRNITERGLTALWKMKKLKLLFLDDVIRSTEFEMTVLLLQEQLPQLEIRVGEFAEDD